MLYRDLRGWLEGVESFGELRVVEGADWNQEIGAVAEVAARSETPPAVLFDKIKDYPAGRRVLTGIHNPTLKRQCLTNHLPLDYTRDQFIDAWKKRLNHPIFLPPRVVQLGTVDGKCFRREGDRSCFHCRFLSGTRATAGDTSAPLTSRSAAIRKKAG